MLVHIFLYVCGWLICVWFLRFSLWFGGLHLDVFICTLFGAVLFCGILIWRLVLRSYFVSLRTLIYIDYFGRLCPVACVQFSLRLFCWLLCTWLVLECCCVLMLVITWLNCDCLLWLLASGCLCVCCLCLVFVDCLLLMLRLFGWFYWFTLFACCITWWLGFCFAADVIVGVVRVLALHFNSSCLYCGLCMHIYY